MNIWAEGFRNDAPNCKPGYKPCGFNCIKQSYNCKADEMKKEKNAARLGLGAALTLGSVASTGYVASRHLKRGNKSGAIRALKRGGKRIASDLAWQAGTGAAITGLAYGLREYNRNNRKKKGN